MNKLLPLPRRNYVTQIKKKVEKAKATQGNYETKVRFQVRPYIHNLLKPWQVPEKY